MMLRSARRELPWLIALLLGSSGCSIGPRAIHHDRIRYNEAIKTSTEEQLLLNIVRLRYIDTPSSLGVSSLADQYELTKNLGLTPFFTSAAAGQAFGGYRGAILPQAGIATAMRPTLTYTPQDDQDFTRRLFTPLSLEATASLSKTTWPISTVFRLWLENLNWISNAETASGPIPRDPPEFAEFLSGVQALQRLSDRKLATIFTEEQDDPIGDDLPPGKITAAAAVAAAKAGYEYRKVEKTGDWRVVRKKQQPRLRIAESANADPDFLEFCRAFKLDQSKNSFDMSTGKLDPYYKDAPKGGLTGLDLETRSLLQVLYFLANGVEVPPAHLLTGEAASTRSSAGEVFDWNQVLHGLFQVCSCQGKRPSYAHVAVQYKDYWFYIDERDRDTKATFSLLVELSRLQLSGEKGAGPMLTLPIGGR
jgi:hypothetical protein